MSQPLLELNETNAETIIIGAGISGLVDAIYMMQLGHNVKLLELRVGFTARENDLFLQYDFVEQILRDFTNFYENGYSIEYDDSSKDMVVRITHDPGKIRPSNPNKPLLVDGGKDWQFVEMLVKKLGIISIGDIQEYLMDKIKEQSMGKFQLINPAKVTDVDPAKNEVYYLDANSSLQVVRFDNLCITEGASRHITRKLLGQQLNTKQISKVESYSCAHSAAFVGVKSDPQSLENFQRATKQKLTSNIYLPLSVKMSGKDLAIFKKLGWDNKELPIFFITVEPHLQRFYVTCEIPAQWENIWREQTDILNSRLSKPREIAAARAKLAKINAILEKWLQQAVSAEFPSLNASDLFLIGGPQIFKQEESLILQTPHIQTSAGGHIFFTGDSLVPGMYKLGVGAYIAGLCGKALHNCFETTGKFKNDIPMSKLVPFLQHEFLRFKGHYEWALFARRHKKKIKYLFEPVGVTTRRALAWGYQKIFSRAREIKNFSKDSPASSSFTDNPTSRGQQRDGPKPKQ